MSKEARVPTVWVHPKAYYTMSYWAKLAGQKRREMTCFARCILEDGDAVVTDVYMVKHEGNSGAVEADDEDVVRLMMELNAEGVPPEEAFRCWVHSHPGTGEGATYLSGTDEEMIDRFMSGDFLVSIVWDSIGGSPFCRIDYKNPRVSIVADLELYLPYLTTEELKEAKDEYDEKASAMVTPVKSFAPYKSGNKGKTSSHSFGMGYGSRGSNYFDDGDDDVLGWSSSNMGNMGYSSNRSTPPAQVELVEADLDQAGATDDGEVDVGALSEDELRSHMATTFEINDEEVQQQWLDWIKSDPNAYYDLLENQRQEVMGESIQYEAVDVSGQEVVMIDLIDDGYEKLEADVEPTDHLSLAESLIGGDEVPSQTARNMQTYLRDNKGVDTIAMSVADGDITKEEGLSLLSLRYELSGEEADSALELRIG